MNQYIISSLEQQLKKDPYSRVFLRLAEELRKGGLFQRAARVCMEGLRHHPNYVPAWVCLGRCRESLGDVAEAEKAFREVLKFAPDNPHALRGLGLIFKQAGQWEQARYHFERLLIQEPADEQLEAWLLEIGQAQDAQAGSGEDASDVSEDPSEADIEFVIPDEAGEDESAPDLVDEDEAMLLEEDMEELAEDQIEEIDDSEYDTLEREPMIVEDSTSADESPTGFETSNEAVSFEGQQPPDGTEVIGAGQSDLPQPRSGFASGQSDNDLSAIEELDEDDFLDDDDLEMPDLDDLDGDFHDHEVEMAMSGANGSFLDDRPLEDDRVETDTAAPYSEPDSEVHVEEPPAEPAQTPAEETAPVPEPDIATFSPGETLPITDAGFVDANATVEMEGDLAFDDFVVVERPSQPTPEPAPPESVAAEAISEPEPEPADANMDAIDLQFEKALSAAEDDPAALLEAELSAGLEEGVDLDPLVDISDPEYEHRTTLGLKHEKMEHYEEAELIYRTLLRHRPGDVVVTNHLQRLVGIMTTETKKRKKIRRLSNWLDKIKGAYHVS
ncbi:Tetratricopeptide repeat protein [Sulfidibacter corallicola]|uniref:Tetratricopeptide repeat protein n=1 Tax=Sulfidibacter corallicola TaxID=2818388 RepID=A0A8A4TV64_SULCO|nr:tetratricopeptide repeat protein [Sulfidibacter corallicola]QTD53014.1 tetratricopeptide repeat protein [Sulfidibacter corallicola]